MKKMTCFLLIYALMCGYASLPALVADASDAATYQEYKEQVAAKEASAFPNPDARYTVVTDGDNKPTDEHVQDIIVEEMSSLSIHETPNRPATASQDDTPAVFPPISEIKQDVVDTPPTESSLQPSSQLPSQGKSSPPRSTKSHRGRKPKSGGLLHGQQTIDSFFR